MFNGLKKLPVTFESPLKQKIVSEIFQDNKNYMKDGILLRQVINLIDNIDFNDYSERHALGEIYETMLKELQSAGNSGEFYTPRAVTDFMVEMIDPKVTDKIADLACGTGGFLTSTIKYMERHNKIQTTSDRQFFENLFGIEKKPLPHLLCITNLLLHDVDSPNVINGNSLEKNVRDYNEDEKFDIILMNPPYGGSEKKMIQNNFPAELRSSETADLFMSVIMYRLKRNGKAAVVLPDGFLFGSDNAKTNIKKKLLEDFNLHTVVRLPKSVFAPYTSITTNILFFDNTHSTQET
ncbi:UNVERIFIED_CONTAM: class I SAM-dependent DNA methyltransferase [Campylobacter lari]